MEHEWKLTSEEMSELRTLVEQAYVGLIRELAAADDRAFKDELRERLDLVESIHQKLERDRDLEQAVV